MACMSLRSVSSYLYFIPKVDANQGVVECDAAATRMIFLYANVKSLNMQIGAKNDVDKDDFIELKNLPLYFDICVYSVNSL